MMPFQEAHWQGLELISLTPGIARVLNLPRHAQGVVVDEATMPADVEGFLAGDLVTGIDGIPTPDLESFVSVAAQFKEQKQIAIEVLRKGGAQTLVLSAFQGPLGTANGETAPMILPGARPPHGYLGPCTNCHHIGGTPELPVDLGDPLTTSAPPIRAGQPRPHRDRGRCSTCHKIL
jgi:hypothetical protein